MGLRPLVIMGVLGLLVGSAGLAQARGGSPGRCLRAAPSSHPPVTVTG
jgi:hypothetical protein